MDLERELDLLLQTMHEADRRLIQVYGDTVHRNDGESIARRYHSMVIAGKLRAGVRMVTSRDGGGYCILTIPMPNQGERWSMCFGTSTPR